MGDESMGMGDNLIKQGRASGGQFEERFFLSIVLIVTLLVYAPLIRSVWDLSVQTTQALNALVLLGVAFLEALLSALKLYPVRPVINTHGLLLLGLSCLALTVSSFTSAWVLAVLGLCLNIGAFLSFCFGRKGVAIFYPALAGFSVIVVMLMLVPQVDSMLRWVAGTVSAWGLPYLGVRASLLVQQDPFQVIIVAENGAGVFNVATECSGFGILMSSVILTLILALRRRVRWYSLAPLLVLSAIIGLGFNIIRIIAIVMASLLTTIRYGLIHEGLGSLIYLMALTAILFLNWLVRRRLG
jgi:exosortase/archaeosortase family protein